MKQNLRESAGTLRGTAIFLALGTGSEDRDSEVRAEALQEALVSLCRAVFSRGGTLVLAESTPLLSLILIMATEYWERDFFSAQDEEAPPAPAVRLFGSVEAEELGWWTQTGLLAADGLELPLETAVRLLIDQARPRAMFCLGGSGTVWRQAILFREFGGSRAIHTISATGGDARRLAREVNNGAEDEELMKKLRSLRREARFPEQRERAQPRTESDEEIIPYPLLMQQLVERLEENRNWGDDRKET